MRTALAAAAALLAGCASSGTPTTVDPAATLAVGARVRATVPTVVVSDDVPRDRFGARSWLAVRVTVTNDGEHAFPLDLRSTALRFHDKVVLNAFATVAELYGDSAFGPVARGTFLPPTTIPAGGEETQWVVFAGFEPGDPPVGAPRITLELEVDGERHHLPLGGPPARPPRSWRVARQPYGATHAGLAMIVATASGRAVGAPMAGGSVGFWHLRVDAELGPALRWESGSGGRVGGALGALGLALSPGLPLARSARLSPFVGMRYALLDAGERSRTANADGVGPEIGVSLALGAGSIAGRSPLPLSFGPHRPPRAIVKAAYFHDWALTGSPARPSLSLTVAFALWP